jgi:hypothetical protein
MARGDVRPTGSERLWDSEGWDVLSTRQVQLARDDGALGVVPIALNNAPRCTCTKPTSVPASSLI